MYTWADRNKYAEFLLAVPALSSCARDVLDDFLTRGVVNVHCPAGKKLSPLTAEERNLYVLASGTAVLNAGDDVTVVLEPGDFFGRSHPRWHQIVASVVAVTDVQILVLNPQEIAQLREVSTSDRRPSRLPWQSVPSATTAATRRPSCRRQGRPVLTSQGA
jgi:CRP-like cAMP-binding protein